MSSKIPVAISFTGVANVLGVLGVIGSLIFVGLELRQTQRIALAEMEQRRSEQTTNRALAFLEGEVETWANVQGVPLSELSPKGRMVREMHWSWATQMQQNTLFQYQEGFISESQWDVIAERIFISWNNCQNREFYDFRFLETAFIEYLETLPDECAE
ncbi:MAG: hypothetical protein ACJZ83_00280 [Pseudohongiellaceae bacterium]